MSELRQTERVISVKDGDDPRDPSPREEQPPDDRELAALARHGGPIGGVKAALQESVLRIGSIALVHETLSASTTDVAEFGDVARRISRMVGDVLVLPEPHIEIKVTGETGPLGADARDAAGRLADGTRAERDGACVPRGARREHRDRAES